MNAATTLTRAIRSVSGQTLKEWELICVDNGSHDESLRLVTEAAATDRRIKVLSEAARGAGPARNTGLRNAQGDFVAFLDSDDQLPSNSTLAQLVEQACKHRVDICGGSMLLHSAKGQTLADFEGPNAPFRFERDGLLSYREYQFDYGFYRFIYKRKMLIDGNLLFPSYKRFQDPPFFVSAMIAAERFYALREPTYIQWLGHQRVEWIEDSCVGLYSGLADNLRISRKQKLEKLHRLTVERLTTEYGGIMEMHNGSRINAVQRAESHCLSSIDVSMLTPREKKLLLEYYRQRQRRNAAADN